MSLEEVFDHPTIGPILARHSQKQEETVEEAEEAEEVEEAEEAENINMLDATVYKDGEPVESDIYNRPSVEDVEYDNPIADTDEDGDDPSIDVMIQNQYNSLSTNTTTTTSTSTSTSISTTTTPENWQEDEREFINKPKHTRKRRLINDDPDDEGVYPAYNPSEDEEDGDDDSSSEDSAVEEVQMQPKWTGSFAIYLFYFL